ncbi:YecA family protein [Seohaeicola saemankumensis]|uniref:YecA/YgfB family protein n=1 Tax=Seohaeicola TaxID=481178 RepID=UPI0035D0C43C
MSNNIDLDALDGYLSSDHSPENCMMLSDLDGFIHGVICSPVMIPSDEWLPVAIGGDPEAVPIWVLNDITDLFMGIAHGLVANPPVVEPIFWQAREGHVIAMDWCEGFMQAVALRPKEWLRLTESGTDGHLVAPIMVHLMDDNGSSVMGIAQEEQDRVLAIGAEAIPYALIDIFNYWRG